jgi:hypothetical protein
VMLILAHLRVFFLFIGIGLVHGVPFGLGNHNEVESHDDPVSYFLP